MIKWLIAFILLVAIPSYAEYRVFRLVITDNITGSKKEILSTLDPFQYIGYYPLKKTEGIDYTDTWRCYEDNSQMQDYCPSPRAKNEGN